MTYRSRPQAAHAACPRCRTHAGPVQGVTTEASQKVSVRSTSSGRYARVSACRCSAVVDHRCLNFCSGQCMHEHWLPCFGSRVPGATNRWDPSCCYVRAPGYVVACAGTPLDDGTVAGMICDFYFKLL